MNSDPDVPPRARQAGARSADASRLSRRRFLTTAAGAGLLTGCATVRAPGGSLVGHRPQDTSSRLRILTDKYPYTAATVDGFTRRNPGVELEVVIGRLSFEEGRAQTLLRSGKSPDVVMVNSGHSRVGLLARAGLIAVLDDIFAKHDITGRYRPEVIEQTRQPQDGRIYEVVEGIDVFQLYYNKEIFARYGLSVPRTWSDLLAACGRLVAAKMPPLVAGIRDNFGGGWLLGALLQASAGREVMAAAITGTGSFEQPAIVRGAGLLRELIDRGFLDGPQAAALDAGQAQAVFLTGSAAMTVMPQVDIINARAEGADVGVFDAFPVPPVVAGTPTLPTAGLSKSWVVNNATQSFSAVGAWMDWVSSEEYLAIAAAHGSSFVPTRIVPAGTRLDSFAQTSLDRLTTGVGFNPSVYLPDAAKEAWYGAVQGIVVGGLDPAVAMKDVQTALTASLAK